MRRRLPPQRDNNIRGQVSSVTSSLHSNLLSNIRQHIRKIIFYDVFTFAAVFLAALFNSLTQRSIIFNIVIGVTLFLKVLIGAFFYNQKTIGALRTYFLARYFYNFAVVCPVWIVLRSLTVTYLPNYIITGCIIVALEIIIGCLYVK